MTSVILLTIHWQIVNHPLSDCQPSTDRLSTIRCQIVNHPLSNDHIYASMVIFMLQWSYLCFTGHIYASLVYKHISGLIIGQGKFVHKNSKQVMKVKTSVDCFQVIAYIFCPISERARISGTNEFCSLSHRLGMLVISLLQGTHPLKPMQILFRLFKPG